MKRLGWLLLLICGLIGCRSGANFAAPQKRLVWAIATDLKTLDPAQCNEINNVDVLRLLVEPLVRVDAKGQVIPALAQSYTFSPDGLSVQFKLRAANFSDGTPVEAEDVLASFRRARNPAISSPESARYLADIDLLTSKALDKQTLEIRLYHPTAEFLSKLSFISGSVMPRRFENKEINDLKDLVGTGLYVADSYTPGQRLLLKSNPKVSSTSSLGWEEIEIRPIPDESTRVSLFRSGEAQLATSISAQTALAAKEPLKSAVRWTPRAKLIFLQFNASTYKPFADPRARRAFLMGLDLARISQDQLGGRMRPANSFIPEGLSGQPNTFSVPFEPRAARALLTEAKFPVDEPLALSINEANKSLPFVEALLIQLNANLGLNVKLRPLPSKSFIDLSDRGALPFALTGFGADSMDPVNALDTLYRSRIDDGASGYKNARVDQQLTQAAREASEEVRSRLVKQIHAQLLQDMPIAPLFFGVDIALVSPRVKEYQYTPFGMMSVGHP